MKYLLAIGFYTIGCLIAFGVSFPENLSPAFFFSLGAMIILLGNLAILGKTDITRNRRMKDFIPDIPKMKESIPVIFGIILIGTSFVALGEKVFVVLQKSPSVGVALWLFLLSLAWKRFESERKCIQQVGDGNEGHARPQQDS